MKPLIFMQLVYTFFFEIGSLYVFLASLELAI